MEAHPRIQERNWALLCARTVQAVSILSGVKVAVHVDDDGKHWLCRADDLSVCVELGEVDAQVMLAELERLGLAVEFHDE